MAHFSSILSAVKLASMTVVQTFWIFCENSSLHGLRYIGRSRTMRANLLMRFVWSVIAMVSLGFTLMLANSAWDQFRSNPTMTTIETTSYPVSQIPFPSVTLCNNNKIHSSKAEELTVKLMAIGIDANDTLDILYNLPRLSDYRSTDQRMLLLEDLLLSKGYSLERLALEAAPPCETMVVHCLWLMQPVQCDQLFRRTKIFAGYCCSFNADVFLEPIFTRPNNSNLPASESIYVKEVGKGEGLSVVLDVGENYYMASNRFSYGIEVFVHRSFDFPDFSDYMAIVERGKETDVSVLPTIVSASSTLRTVPLAMRGCAFDDEGNRSTSIPYTYSNCMNECEQRYIASVCKCIPLWKQTVELQALLEVPICGFKDLTCLMDLKQRVSFASEQISEISNTTPQINFSAYGVLHVHFRSTNCLKYRREPFVTWQSLVATFGGIFGLCMGGSILSLVELLYHFGITPFIVYNELREKLSKRKAHPSPTINAIVHLDYPGHQPIGYFRRREVLTRAINNGDAMWGVTKKRSGLDTRWKQHYVDELKIIP
uniref:Amiloride-sensitive sodium channel n=1 Tax=Anopheles farauti TaxID=69004 RepID=A0A182QEN4_9DIPT